MSFVRECLPIRVERTSRARSSFAPSQLRRPATMGGEPPRRVGIPPQQNPWLQTARMEADEALRFPLLIQARLYFRTANDARSSPPFAERIAPYLNSEVATLKTRSIP